MMPLFAQLLWAAVIIVICVNYVYMWVRLHDTEFKCEQFDEDCRKFLEITSTVIGTLLFALSIVGIFS